jgi:hypothetical protein
MATGDVPALIKIDAEDLPEGSSLFRVHAFDPFTGKYPPTAFNPSATGRFSACLATPARSMFYAATTRTGALWETVLRERVATPPGSGEIALFAEEFANRRLVEVTTTRPLRVLSIYASPLKNMVGAFADVAKWLELTLTPKHADTHDPVARLLTLAESGPSPVLLHGVRWKSVQSGSPNVNPIAYVFYDLPANPSCFVSKPTYIDLGDGNDGWEVIDEALAEASLVRARTDPDAGKILAEDP